MVLIINCGFVPDDDSGYVVIRAIRPPNMVYRPAPPPSSNFTPSPAAIALLATTTKTQRRIQASPSQRTSKHQAYMSGAYIPQVVLITGISPDERNFVPKMIQKLGAVVIKSNHNRYNNNSKHTTDDNSMVDCVVSAARQTVFCHREGRKEVAVLHPVNPCGYIAAI